MSRIRRLTAWPAVRAVCALVVVAALLSVAQPAPAAAATLAGSTVPPVITITGNVFDPFARTPVAGAHVAFVERGRERILATSISDAQGVYSVALATGGKPIDAYVRATRAGRVTTYIFPPAPLTTDMAPCPPFAGTLGCILVAMLTDTAADDMAGFAGVTRDPTRGEVLFIAANCQGIPVAGATVAIAPHPEQLVYTRGPFPAWDATATDSTGRSFGFNLEPGPATVRSKYPDGRTGVTQVLIAPGAITIASTLPQNAHCTR